MFCICSFRHEFRRPPLVLTVAAAAAIFGLGFGAGARLHPSAATEATVETAPPSPPAVEPATAAPATRGVEVVRVIDGDTFEARVALWPGLSVTTKVRLRGIDAPEMAGRCERERVSALAAREALVRLLAEGEIALHQVANDKYGGRVLAAVSTRATPDVSAALLTAGVTRPYAGRRRESWCEA